MVIILFDLCLFRLPSIISLFSHSNKKLLMENPTEKTPSSTPSIDERDLILSMRKLDLIKELGFVIN